MRHLNILCNNLIRIFNFRCYKIKFKSKNIFRCYILSFQALHSFKHKSLWSLAISNKQYNLKFRTKAINIKVNLLLTEMWNFFLPQIWRQVRADVGLLRRQRRQTPRALRGTNDLRLLRRKRCPLQGPLRGWSPQDAQKSFRQLKNF